MGEMPSLQQLHHNSHQLSIRATLQAMEIKSILAEISYKISYWPSPPPPVMSTPPSPVMSPSFSHSTSTPQSPNSPSPPLSFIQSNSPAAQPRPLSLPLPSNSRAPSSLSPSKPIVPSSYPIKRLTYSEMQQLRDQGLCLNCNEVENPSHLCSIQRILLVMLDEEPNYIDQQPMKLLQPVDPKAPRFESAAMNEVVTKSIANVSFLCNLSDYGDAYFGNGVAKDPYINMVKKFIVSVILNFNPTMNWKENEYTHFSMVLVESTTILLGESKVFIFDPGGIFDVKQHSRSFDLEDKVIFRAGGNDTTTHPKPTMCSCAPTWPKKLIKVHAKYYLE